MDLRLLFCAVILPAVALCYPVRCSEIGDSPLGTVTDCDVLNDPMPFHWTSTVRLKKNIKWAGIDDVSYIYSNSNESVIANCTLAAPEPGTYSRNDNITIEQTCFNFNPQLAKYATLIILFFYSHHDSFDDVLMYNYPIPGTTQPHRIITGPEKEKILKELWARDMLKKSFNLLTQ